MPSTKEAKEEQQIYWDDVSVGDELPTRRIGPLSPAHLFRWSAAIENWHRIHYDAEFATSHERLPGIVVQGSWKQSAIPQYLKDWCLPDGWVWRVKFQHRRMILAWDTVTLWGRVTGKERRDGLGIVNIELGMKTGDGQESCPGDATVILPIRGGVSIPYPFPGIGVRDGESRA